MRHQWFAAAAIGLLSSAAAFGQTVSESFDYPDGSLTGRNGGTGFTGAFTGAGSVTSPGLSTGTVTSAGGKFSTGSTSAAPNVGAFRTINPIGTDAGTVFVGFLTSAGGATLPNYGGISFFSGGSEELFLGKPSNTNNYGFAVSGNVANVFSTTAATTATTLLVYRIGFTPNGDRIDLFVNPTPGAELPATPDATFTTPAETTTTTDAFPNAFDRIRLQSGDQSFNFDEFRIGDSFAAVAPPVPEPASLGLLAVGGLLALRRRRA